MSVVHRAGHLRAVAFDGALYVLPLEAYASVRMQWMKGEAFWSGFDTYGSPIDIKLSRIEALIQVTPAALARREIEEEAEKAEAMLRGDDD